ncbi:MAG TPA: hypothetical protein VFL76_03165 [Edaphocola sp.]|nr:hypothetical protein [Edaphocola sp.]
MITLFQEMADPKIFIDRRQATAVLLIIYRARNAFIRGMKLII